MSRPRRVGPGQVLRVPEEHYRFGTGVLVLRVQAVLGVRHLDDGPWLVVRGVEVHGPGRDGPVREEVLIRLSALGRSATGGAELSDGDSG